MLANPNIRRAALLLVAVATTFGLSSCQTADEGDLVVPADLLGNGLPDETEVVCRFGDHEITERDLELRLDEMPSDYKQLFSGEGAERRLLEYVIAELIQADASVESGLLADPMVRRQLITQWRTTLRDAYAQLVLWDDIEPSEAEIRDRYEELKHTYVTEGQVKARHIQCRTLEKAEAAYAQLQDDGYDSLFANVVAVYSENRRTKRMQGDLGWFSRKGFIPTLDNGPTFATAVFDLDRGLHEPMLIDGQWHIVEIVNREPSRQLTLDEVRDRIADDLLPSVQQKASNDFVAERRKSYEIEYLGEFRPGQGRTAEELLRLGMLANSFERAEQLYELLLLDYRDSEYAPMALFMLANLHLDTYADTYSARNCLNRILNNYPEAEIREQAEYMLENLGQRNFQSPQTIEELRELE